MKILKSISPATIACRSVAFLCGRRVAPATLMRRYIVCAMAPFWLLVSAEAAEQLATIFTYQGRLTAPGNLPVRGYFDLELKLFDALTNGNQIAETRTNAAVYVDNGLFTTRMNFGPDIFNGSNYWLEVGLRSTNAPEPFRTFAPRQQIFPVPYALYASKAASADSVAATNVHWSNIIGVPSGFADGVDNNTVYSAPEGAGLTLLGTNFSLADGGVTAQKLASNSVTASKLAPGSVTPDKLAITNCEPGDVLKFNSMTMTWECAPDENTTYSAPPGSGLTLSGGEFRVLFAPIGVSDTVARGDHSHDASNVVSGILRDERLSPNIARLDGALNFTGSNIFRGVNSLTNAGNNVAGTFSGNGAGLTNLNANLLDGLNSTDFATNNHNHDSTYWKLGGNIGTTTNDFLGTTGALEFKVNNKRAMLLDPLPPVALPPGPRVATYGQISHSGGSFGSPGDAQSSTYVLRATTSGVATNQLIFDGCTSNCLVVPPHGRWTFEVSVIASSVDPPNAPTNQVLGFFSRGFIERDGTTPVTRLVAIGPPAVSNDNPAWSLQVDKSEAALVIKGGVASGTDEVRWVATVRTTELIFPPPPP